MQWCSMCIAVYWLNFSLLDMHPLAAASRSRLLETEPKLFVFETSYAFCGRYCFESVASQNVNSVKNNIERYCIE